jgi:hypothetical protein
MKKKFLSILTALLLASLISSSALAGGNVRLTNVQFSLGSLIADGYASGLGRTDVTVVLDASGERAQISCINSGGTIVPGQSSPKINAVGVQNLAGNDANRKNGKAPFDTETSDDISWDVAGCPNSNWTGHIDFVFWTEATIAVHEGYNNPNGPVLVTQSYTCITTQNPDTVSCSPK